MDTLRILVISLLGLTIGCSSEEPVPAGSGSSNSTDRPPIDAVASSPFTPVPEDAGIRFTHYNARSPVKMLPETMGSGVAFFDFDNDDYPDLFFLNGSSLIGKPGGERTSQLYRNQGDGTFSEVTANSGLDDQYFAMGVGIGDFDNDGYTDLATTGADRARIYRNLGNGRFQDISSQAGVDAKGFGSGVAFLDYDRDGWLDLFIARYVEWTPETDIPCSPDGTTRTYCTPELYPGISNVLYRNIEGKRFEDVSSESGIGEHLGKALGIAVFDSNGDHWPDIAVANDTAPNFLFVNQGDGTFIESGIDTGMAYSESGAARGGMGIDTGDVDRDGAVDIVIGNFSQEMVAYFRGAESGYYIDDAAPAGLGLPTLMTLAFGTLVEDFDNDSWLDVLVVNGHIEPEIAETRQSQSYQQPPQFFRNLGEGKFGQPIEKPFGDEALKFVARGFASADYDRDGDVDFIISQNGGPACLLRNNTSGNHWLQLRLEGTRSNRSAFGSKVEVFIGDTHMVRFLSSGRSYLSASSLTVPIGLAKADRVDRLVITWPSGTRQELTDVKADQLIKIKESAQ